MSSALKIQDLKKVYKNGVEAIKGINFEVKAGDFFALLGPNGAGKSTTIGIVSSTVIKTAGQIEIMGHDLEKEPFQAKRYLGIMPQEINLNSFETPMQILITQAGYYGVSREAAAKRATMLLEKLGLLEKRDQIAQRLSGGMKRRLMIARALIHDPKIVILDEPTAGVDVELRKLIWDFLVELNRQGLTIILTTHYLEEAENLCRNIAIIHKGEIIRSSSMSHLIAELEEESIIFDMAEPLSELPHIPWTATLLNPHQLRVNILRGQSLNTLFKALDEKNIKILSMRNEANRLEQLFVKLIQEKV